jgi:hypothetical protein
MTFIRFAGMTPQGRREAEVELDSCPRSREGPGMIFIRFAVITKGAAEMTLA